MASRPILPPMQVMTNADMSLASSVSLVTVIQNISMLSYEVEWSGATPIGVMDVQVSNDYSQNADGTVRNPGTWTSIPSLSSAVTGNTGTGFFDIVQTGAYAIRLQYTRTSGTGAMQAFINGKVS